MRIRLLGTGSADGWPNPFCTCASCTAERRDGRSRQPSSALLDDVIVIDCGPTATHAASAAGVSLHGVEHVLITHGHPDHLDPAFLLARDWIATQHTLHVWGPAGSIDLCRPWLGPDTSAVLHVVSPGDETALATRTGTYTIRVLNAQHSSGNADPLSDEAVLYLVTDRHGSRLLYATDTAALAEATVRQLTAPVDLVLIDETFGDKADHCTGHLDLTSLPHALQSLRDSGAITDDTTIVATHLSHHNPPTRELAARLAELGVHLVDDHTVLDTSAPLAWRTGSRQFVIGGARSGKSRHAESQLTSREDVTYIATGGSRDDDPEWHARVMAHRQRRPSAWRTVETLDVAAHLRAAEPGSAVLVDCLALWLTGHLDGLDAWTRLEAGDRDGITTDIALLTDDLIEALEQTGADVVLVSNEVGMSVVPQTGSGRLFQDLLGIVNARVASACDRTVLVVAGQPLTIRDTATQGKQA